MTPKQILVPIDFSACSEHALDQACSYAEKLGAKIHLVHAIAAVFPELDVTLTKEMVDSLVVGNLARLTEMIDDRASLATFGEPIVRVADPRDAILDAAEVVKADLIVIGTHGRRGLSRLVLGSVAEDVLRRAPCPVLAVRSKKG